MKKRSKQLKQILRVSKTNKLIAITRQADHATRLLEHQALINRLVQLRNINILPINAIALKGHAIISSYLDQAINAAERQKNDIQEAYAKSTAQTLSAHKTLETCEKSALRLFKTEQHEKERRHVYTAKQKRFWHVLCNKGDQ